MVLHSFSMSGNLGDLIYSLAVVKKLSGGIFRVKLGNIPTVIRKYNNGPVPPEYEGTLTQSNFDMLSPLLFAQTYIDSVEVFDEQKHLSTVDLDEFRGVIHRSVRGNFLKAFYTTHKIQYNDSDLIQPWLTVPTTIRDAKYVVARSPRWRSRKETTVDTWKQLIEANNISQDGVFVGLKSEHEDFEKTMGISIAYRPVQNFLELAQVIAGGDVFFGNQTFTYAIAQGLGKSTVLETFSDRTLEVNECFFARSDCYYF